jgi:hypothetical protein
MALSLTFERHAGSSLNGSLFLSESFVLGLEVSNRFIREVPNGSEAEPFNCHSLCVDSARPAADPPEVAIQRKRILESKGFSVTWYAKPPKYVLSFKSR